MKKILVGLSVILFVAACSKQNETPTNTVNETVDTTAMQKQKGEFINGPFGSVMGSARIYLKNGKYLLALENVVISNGPDLHVYLSQEVLPINFIDLGKLKSTNGNQLYEVSGMLDFTKYKYALVHCQQYNHLFGSATLE